MSSNSNLAYIVFRSGQPSAQRRVWCGKLRQSIVARGKQRDFPIIRYESGASRDCLIGVAVEIRSFVSDLDAQDQLAALATNLFPKPPSHPMVIHGFDQLRGLLSQSVGCEGFTTSLQFERTQIGEAASEQLRQSLDDPSVIEVDIPDQLSPQHNRLLHWCSCVGFGDLGRLIGTAQTLGALPRNSRPWPMLRRMLLLGHIEVARTPSGWRWSVAPAVRITPVKGGAPFSAGRRLPSDLKVDGLVCEPQTLGPDLAFCTMWTGAYSANRIADALPELDQFVASASAWDETDFHDYHIQRVDDEGHCEHIIAPTQDPYGVHVFERDDQTVYAWFDRPRGRWIASDPLTISFLHRANAGLAAAAIGEDGSLVVPWTDRWPIPYERAMVLASGQLPRLVRNGDGALLLKYKDIPLEMATQVAGKLKVHLGGHNA